MALYTERAPTAFLSTDWTYTVASKRWFNRLEKASEALNDAIDNKCALVALRILAVPFLCIPTSLVLATDLIAYFVVWPALPFVCIFRPGEDNDRFLSQVVGTSSILALHLLALGVLSLIPLLCSQLENPLTDSRIREMTPDQASRVSSNLKTYKGAIDDSSLSITLAPTPLETLIASREAGVTHPRHVSILNNDMLIEKSREKNRMIPAIILQTRQGKSIETNGVITPLEFAFLMKYTYCSTLIRKGAQLSPNPLPLVHSAILAPHSVLFDSYYLRFQIDYLKKIDRSVELVTSLDTPHVSANELPWYVTQLGEGEMRFKNTLLVSALKGYEERYSVGSTDGEFELFERLFALGANFHQASIDDERFTLSKKVIETFEYSVEHMHEIDEKRYEYQTLMNRYRVGDPSIYEEFFQTVRDLMANISHHDDHLEAIEKPIKQAPFQAFLDFHRKIVKVVDTSMDKVLPLEVSHLICEYITNINNTLALKYEILSHPLRNISLVLPECIPCLIVSEYLEEVDYSPQIAAQRKLGLLHSPYHALRVQNIQQRIETLQKHVETNQEVNLVRLQALVQSFCSLIELALLPSWQI